MHDLPLAYVASAPTQPSARPPLLVLLHGYGANEQDLIGLAPYLDQRLLVLSPRAPLVLAPFSFAWFEIGFTQEGIAVDPGQALRSRALLFDFVRQAATAHNIDATRIYLVGFSQGATMAALTALSHPGLAAAVGLLSGIVPTSLLDELPASAAPGDARSAPFFVAHGRGDSVVPVAHGRATRALLEEQGLSVSYHEYDMGHAINDACLRDLAAWLTRQIDDD
jgi:phospholipase/carboxylesterase